MLFKSIWTSVTNPLIAAEVSAEDISHDSEYLVTVQVGTPPRPYRLDFDTGSSDLWIAGKGTKEKGVRNMLFLLILTMPNVSLLPNRPTMIPLGLQLQKAWKGQRGR